MDLHTARIFVKHMDSARRFYADGLGLAIKADGAPHGYCVFTAGSMDLVVETVADDAPEDDQALVGRFTGLSFTVPDVEAKYLELSARGVRFSGRPERQFWGGILATLHDPAGNQLQIVQLATAASPSAGIASQAPGAATGSGTSFDAACPDSARATR